MSKTYKDSSRKFWSRSPVERPHGTKNGNRGYKRLKTRLIEEEIVEEEMKETLEEIVYKKGN